MSKTKHRVKIWDCIALTCALFEMCADVFQPLPTWLKVILVVGSVVIFLPDEIEIWI